MQESVIPAKGDVINCVITTLRHILFALMLLFSHTNYAASSTLPSFADIVEPLLPAVVNVYTAQQKKQYRSYSKIIPRGFPFDQFGGLFERFELPLDTDELYSNTKVARGSGFITDADGYIVTNHHVIGEADEIFIKLCDGTEIKATLIGSDQRTDLALLKIDPKKPLPFVKFGDSSSARVGDWIIAIGNPFGLGGTVTAGIISSKGRDISIADIGVVDDFIQTDAAINSGNSGGPMFNLQGEVIGVNTAIFSPAGTNIGIGFAIPSSTVLNIIQQLKEHGKVSRGLLNIKIQDVTNEIAEGLGMSEPSGALVFDVETGGAGAGAGLKPGDIILEFNGVSIKNSRKLQIAVAETKINSDAKVIVLRGGKKHELKCHVTESDKKHSASNAKLSDIVVPLKGSIEKHGIIFSDLSTDLSRLFGLKESERGVVVSGFQESSDAKWRGLIRGDIIVAVNQQPISTLRDFESTYAEATRRGRKNIVLLVRREGMMLFMAMPLS